VMAGNRAVTTRPPQLGFRCNAGEAKPSCACGSSSGGLGRSLGLWVGHGASGDASSPAALMAGGSGLWYCSGAREEKGGGVL
jgi:hypothetical protein